ncbi:hypothetical protein ACJX0J_010534, partial [Zea mays]
SFVVFQGWHFLSSIFVRQNMGGGYNFVPSISVCAKLFLHLEHTIISIKQALKVLECDFDIAIHEKGYVSLKVEIVIWMKIGWSGGTIQTYYIGIIKIWFRYVQHTCLFTTALTVIIKEQERSNTITTLSFISLICIDEQSLAALALLLGRASLSSATNVFVSIEEPMECYNFQYHQDMTTPIQHKFIHVYLVLWLNHTTLLLIK